MPVGKAADSEATLVFLGASMPCSTTSRITSAPAPTQPAAPSRPPAGHPADRALAPHAVDLWVDLLSDLIVAEICREHHTTAGSVDGSDASTIVAEVSDGTSRPAAPSDEVGGAS